MEVQKKYFEDRIHSSCDRQGEGKRESFLNIIALMVAPHPKKQTKGRGTEERERR